jgi:hypothetical protein
MDRDELRYREAAQRKNLSLHKNDEGTWSLGAPVSTEPLTSGGSKPIETFISDDRMRMADGQEFKRVMTTAELKEYLGLD